MTARGFSIVVAMDRNRGIGNKGDLPWPKLKGDMRFFRELTTCPDREAVEKRWGLKPGESSGTSKWEEVSANLKFAHKLPEASWEPGNIVVMGRKTWESLPDGFRPLKGRRNIVLSRSKEFMDKELSITKELDASRNTQIYEGNIGSILESLSQEESFFRSNVSGGFVIGGGQIFWEAIQDSDCPYLYITEIDAEFECDVFFPKTSEFHPALSSPWIEENGIRYRFTRWDRI